MFSYTTQADTRTINVQNVALLKAVSNVDPNAALGGGDITIVSDSALIADAGPLGTMADIAESLAQNGQISVYTVRKGDTVSKIAGMFDVSVNTIIWANNLSRNSILKEGQDLIILPVTGVKYTVKSGDRLDKIAKKYGGDVDEILKYNDIESASKLAIGDEIIIPGGKDYSEAKATPSALKRFNSFPEYVGYYIRPINGGRKTQDIHGYNGVDLAPDCKCSGVEPIYAAASGRVIVSKNSGWNSGYGTYIVISHANGTQTVYSHNARNIVFEGKEVVQGQVIGYVGSTGNSTGPHLHFEVRGARNPFSSR